MDAPATVKRGRPKKEDVVEEVLVQSAMTEVRHVFRVMAIPGHETYDGSGPQPANVIEDHLNQNYLAQGYELKDVFHVRVVVGEGEKPIGHELLYVLVKYA